MSDTVFFTFKPQTDSAAQDRILSEIKTWQPVVNASRLKPSSDNAFLRRKCFAQVAESVEEIVDRLRRYPEIANASLPAERELVMPAGVSPVVSRETHPPFFNTRETSSGPVEGAALGQE